MRRQIMRGMAMLGLMLVTAAGAYAQLTHRVEAIVPFEFSVSGKLLPDGKYIVRQATSGSLKIESLDGSTAEMALAQYVRSNTPKKEATLVFERITGEHYFLSQIWEPFGDAGVQIPRCRAERELIGRTLASSLSNREHLAGPELVFVTARLL